MGVEAEDKGAGHSLPVSHSAPDLGQPSVTQAASEQVQEPRAASTPTVTRQDSINQTLFDMFGSDYNVSY